MKYENGANVFDQLVFDSFPGIIASATNNMPVTSKNKRSTKNYMRYSQDVPLQ